MKKILLLTGLVALAVLLTGALTAAAPMPVVEFQLVQGLPGTMNVGETATVIVEVISDTPFLYAQALPSDFYPGRGVTAAEGDRVQGGQTAHLEVTFTAKDPTDAFANSPGYDLVSVVVGVRFPGGYVATERYDFTVTVP